jgi:hypothetical protein
MSNKSQLEVIGQEITKELANEDVKRALLATTFKGLNENSMRQAIFEGVMRGFTFKNFLEKDIYAIPFKSGYSLITSIDFARKKGMRSGVVGSKEPVFEEKDGKLISCTVTVSRRVDEYVGDYSAKVFFKEYFKAGKDGYPSLWESKPFTMIAKVAEMHALRKACPEELSQSYIEEEMQKEVMEIAQTVVAEDFEKKLKSTKNLDELKKVVANLPIQAKQQFKGLIDLLKEEFTPNENPKI